MVAREEEPFDACKVSRSVGQQGRLCGRLTAQHPAKCWGVNPKPGQFETYSSVRGSTSPPIVTSQLLVKAQIAGDGGGGGGGCPWRGVPVAERSRHDRCETEGHFRPIPGGYHPA